MIVVGYDQAPRGIGFASGEPGAVPVRGWRENPDYGDNEYPLFRDVVAWGKNHMRSVGADVIYTEQIIVRPTHGKGAKGQRTINLNTNVLFKQVAVMLALHAAAGELRIDSYQANIDGPNGWRHEFFAGSRPTKGADSLSDVWKEMALAECLRRGWLTDDHNIAEACGIWDFGCGCSDKQYRSRQKRHVRIAQHKRTMEAA